MFSRIVNNFEPVNTRYETLEGKQYLVVPSVMMTPGVRTGSEGPVLYLPEELNKNISIWNYKPVTIQHPQIDGMEGISACDPVVLERQKIGLIFNTTYKDKLANESWLDEVKCNNTSDGAAILNAAKTKTMMEVSTGMYMDREEKEGEYQGTLYTKIARNIKGDHLAILPDKIGACSIEMGGGLMRNAKVGELSYGDIREQLQILLRGTTSDYCYICEVYPKYAIYEQGNSSYKVGYSIRGGKVSLSKDKPTEVRRVVSYVTNLAPSVLQVQNSLKETYVGLDKEADWNEWILETLTHNHVTFSKDEKQISLPFTFSGAKIVFDKGIIHDGTSPKNTGNEMTTPNTVTNAIVESAANILQTGTKLAIDNIIASGRAPASSRPYLESLAIEQLSIIGAQPAPAAAPPVAPAVPTLATVLAPVPAPAAPAAPLVAPALNQAPLPIADWLQTAPVEVQSLVKNAMAQEQANRAQYIKVITNRRADINPEFLKTQSTDTLVLMAKVAVGTKPESSGTVNNYAGQSGVPTAPPMFLVPQADQTVNNAADDEILSLPSFS